MRRRGNGSGGFTRRKESARKQRSNIAQRCNSSRSARKSAPGWSSWRRNRGKRAQPFPKTGTNSPEVGHIEQVLGPGSFERSRKDLNFRDSKLHGSKGRFQSRNATTVAMGR